MRLIAVLMLISSLCFAKFDCSRNNGIKKVQGGYLYDARCHALVGVVVKENELQKEQITELKRTIELKDLALTKSDQRAAMWQATAFKLEDRIYTLDRIKTYNSTIYFILGILTTSAAIYAGSKVTR